MISQRIQAAYLGPTFAPSGLLPCPSPRCEADRQSELESGGAQKHFTYILRHGNVSGDNNFCSFYADKVSMETKKRTYLTNFSKFWEDITTYLVISLESFV